MLDPLAVTYLDLTGIGTAMDHASRRAIIVVTIDRIAGSCGYAVPRAPRQARANAGGLWVLKSRGRHDEFRSESCSQVG